jgi:hypothetical protein
MQNVLTGVSSVARLQYRLQHLVMRGLVAAVPHANMQCSVLTHCMPTVGVHTACVITLLQANISITLTLSPIALLMLIPVHADCSEV